MSLDKLGPEIGSPGGRGEVQVEDDDVRNVLRAILKELEKMNLHMEVLTDNHITNEDI